MLSTALGVATLLVPAQLVVGHLSGQQVAANQPAKLAAIEARWNTQQPASLVLLGWPDEQAEENRCAIVIPNIGGLVDTGDYDAVMPGLKTWPREDRPPVAIPFFAFRIMVGMALVMLLVVGLSVLLRVRGRLFEARWFLRLTTWCIPTGFVAVLTGWFTAEVGRQPWVVYNHLRTAEAVSPIAGGNMAFSLALFVLIYTVIFGTGAAYLVHLIRRGPEAEHDRSLPVARTPKRPLSTPGRGPSLAA